MERFEVGDKIRILDRSKIFVSDDIRDGEIYEVTNVEYDGDLITILDDCDTALIDDGEFHAIEKVVSG